LGFWLKNRWSLDAPWQTLARYSGGAGASGEVTPFTSAGSCTYTII